MAATNMTLLLLLLFIFFFSAALAQPAPAPKNGPLSGGPIEFIRASCKVTLYPEVCFDSLSGSAATIQMDPIRLAWAATKLTLTEVQSVLGHTKELSKGSSNPKEMAALRYCTESLDDAADLTQQSAEEIGLLVSAEGEEIAWHVSNAQTRLSVAITNEYSCTDATEEVAAGAMKDDMSGRVLRVEQLTSIALALVNHLVS